MTESDLFNKISKVVSKDRLEAYRQKDEPDIDALARYLWNTCLCEALYPVLQNLEVAFRNSLYQAISVTYKDDRWYYDNKVVRGEKEQDAVNKAEKEIEEEKKQLTTGRMVAQLSFGFWTSLLSSYYDYTIWRQPGLIKVAFPYLSKYQHKRHFLSGRFTDIRRLRNRVFHHEPIWKRDIKQDHAMMIETIGWFSPELKRTISIIDRVSIVCDEEKIRQIKASLIKDFVIEKSTES